MKFRGYNNNIIKTDKQIKEQANKRFKTQKKRLEYITTQKQKKEQNKAIKAQKKADSKLYPYRGVYVIKLENIKNNDVFIYVGSSLDCLKRYNEHKKTIWEKYNLNKDDWTIRCNIDEHLPINSENIGSIYSRKGWLLVRECIVWNKHDLLINLNNNRNHKMLNQCPWLLLSNVNFLGYNKGKNVR